MLTQYGRPTLRYREALRPPAERLNRRLTLEPSKFVDAVGKKADISDDRTPTEDRSRRDRSPDRQRSGTCSPTGPEAVLLSRRESMPPGIAVMLDQMRYALLALRDDDSGATVIEYALILVLISITVVAWATFVGTTVSNFFMQVASCF